MLPVAAKANWHKAWGVTSFDQRPPYLRNIFGQDCFLIAYLFTHAFTLHCYGRIGRGGCPDAAPCFRTYSR